MKKLILFIAIILALSSKSYSMTKIYDAIHRKDTNLLSQAITEKKVLSEQEKTELLTEVKELINTAKSNMILRKSANDILSLIFGANIITASGALAALLRQRRHQTEFLNQGTNNQKNPKYLDFTEKLALSFTAIALTLFGCKKIYQGWYLESALQNLNKLREIEDIIKKS